MAKRWMWCPEPALGTTFHPGIDNFPRRHGQVGLFDPPQQAPTGPTVPASDQFALFRRASIRRKEERFIRKIVFVQKEATARIKISRLLDQAGWWFFDEDAGPANIVPERNVKLTHDRLVAVGTDLEKSPHAFVDFLLLDGRGKPLIVLEVKSADKTPLPAKDMARKYDRSQIARLVILSNGNFRRR